jgi:hypothetical protein
LNCGNPSQGAQERFLGDIFGFARVAQAAQSQVIGKTLVSQHQRAKRLGCRRRVPDGSGLLRLTALSRDLLMS